MTPSKAAAAVKDPEIRLVDGKLYRFTETQFYTCANCERATMTGLCGCPNANPLPTHKLPFGLPVERQA